MPSALFLSPHLDDVAFSCGGTLATLVARGWEATLCTVFTRSVEGPSGFALACQLDKGVGPEIDYLALRRAEDTIASRALGATWVDWLNLSEAPHRGYESASALFGPFVEGDDAGPELYALLERRIAAYDLIFAPQGLGSHVDHRCVRDTVHALAEAHALRDNIVLYRDTPYVLRDPDALLERSITTAYPVAVAFPLDETALEAKLDACGAYVSQLTFQFGSPSMMREALRAFAGSEGSRFAIGAPSEVFRATSS